MQVSDRRLSLAGAPVDGEFNKAILWQDVLMFAYTGVAELDSTPTDEWITLAVQDATSAMQALDLLRSSAPPSVRSIPRQYRRLAIVGVGWGRFTDLEYLEPYQAIVSNFVNAEGTFVDRALDDFKAQVYRLKHDLVVSAIPPPILPRPEHAALQRSIRRYLQHSVSPGPIVGLMCDAVRKVASRNQTVSKSLMVNYLPSPSGGPRWQLIAGDPTWTQATFLLVPEDDDNGYPHTPNLVLPGGAVVLRSSIGDPGGIAVDVRPPEDWPDT